MLKFKSHNISESPEEARYLESKGLNLTLCTVDVCPCSDFTIGFYTWLSDLWLIIAAYAFRTSINFTTVSLDPVAIRFSSRGLQSTVFMSDACTSVSLTTGLFPCRRSQIISDRSTPTLHKTCVDLGLKHKSSTLLEWASNFRWQ